jgi:pyruvate formate lyase activating enzyme
MKESYLYEKLTDKRVRCNTCSQRCLILPGKRGICGTRENINGKLYSLVYGKAIAEHVDPIEKKPLFHFLPGSFSLSIATVGCCFRCSWCQNYEISQAPKPDKPIEGFDLPPEKIVKDAKAQGCQSISYTYTEPSIFLEYALDTMKLAKKEGLLNNWVSDGYMTHESLDLIAPYLDAINVDLKAFKEETYQKYIGGRLQPVLDNLKEIYARKIHLEITTLVIPGVNDSEKELTQIAQFIKDELGPEIPWHISRFFPAYKMLDVPPTPIETLEKAYEIGKKVGLKFVYLGNVSDPKKESTYCPKCGEPVIERIGYQVNIKNLKNGKCGKCGEDLNIRC